MATISENMQVKKVTVEVRSLFKRSFRKLYHRIHMRVNGIPVGKIDLSGDSWNMYIYFVFRWLKSHGYICKEGNESPWECAERLGIELDCRVKRVRKLALL